MRALGTPDDRAQAKADAAVQLFRSGRFVDSLALWRQVAALLPGDPRPLWNIARALEELGRIGEAVAAFRAYIRAETDPGLEAEARIDELGRPSNGTPGPPKRAGGAAVGLVALVGGALYLAFVD